MTAQHLSQGHLLPQPLLLLLLLTFPPCLLCCSYIAKRLCQASGKPMGSCFSDQMMMTIIFVSNTQWT
jgi:hypothetical protein